MNDAAIYTLPIMETTERKAVLRHFPSFKKPSPLDGQISAVLKKMEAIKVDHADYPKMMELLERLYELKNSESRKPVSRDTMLIVFGSFIEMFLLVAYEQKHVMTSKGYQLKLRPKVP